MSKRLELDAVFGPSCIVVRLMVAIDFTVPKYLHKNYQQFNSEHLKFCYFLMTIYTRSDSEFYLKKNSFPNTTILSFFLFIYVYFSDLFIFGKKPGQCPVK